ncbi:hypothetical protein CULT_2110001 [[Clostridium] ultunense Esp]|uniref:hypothetical protein n=1 Tax=Thermicanus aegyptius TaxID=94009 RepID=UPI0002B6FD3E|nr:hypothetical protein [Thermicanus aegyptius]MBE3594145.1 hypothetical protein [Candidatus Carbobacillus altaicus]CCQ94913.1 hypothetical protein CULT_2110001 [[Clostridium] ultunense Esp]
MIKKQILWITLVVIILSALFYKTIFIEDKILVEVENLNSNPITDGSFIYFNETINLPIIKTGQKFKETIDISQQKGEGSLKFKFRIGNGHVREIIVIGYMEGGQPKNYKGKAYIKIDKEGNATVNLIKGYSF